MHIPEIESSITKAKTVYKTFDEQLASADKVVKVLYQDLANYVLSLGDDISENHLKLYAAFKKIKNVITVVAQKKKLVINLPLDTATVTFEEGIKLTIDWYLNNQDWIKNIEAKKLSLV